MPQLSNPDVERRTALVRKSSYVTPFGRNATMNNMKRISVQGYQALRDALAVTTWYKKQFERLLRDALQTRPELLAGAIAPLADANRTDALNSHSEFRGRTHMGKMQIRTIYPSMTT